MSCIVVVGGQYGSEGKGKVVSFYSSMSNKPWVVRCGGSNAGHTTFVDGKNVILRQVPAGVTNPDSMLLLSAGCAVDVDVLLQEIDMLKIDKHRIIVDPRAILIENIDRLNEVKACKKIASTGSGTGAALIRRMLREHITDLAENSTKLKRHVTVESVAPLLHSVLDQDGHVIVEGTQGFGLSLLHGPYYPYLTARDTTAAGFAMEVGLSPRQIDFITMVIRTFPIRVGGNSGPMGEEITWEDVHRISGSPEPSVEHTSVTKRVRRVAKFDMKAVKNACMYNRPTSLAIMGLDRLNYHDRHINHLSNLSEKGRQFIQVVERKTRVPVTLVGSGFGTEEIFFIK